MSLELERERRDLAQCDRDITKGQERIRKQLIALAQLRAHGLETGDGERLFGVMRDTLVQWERHREMIVARIAYLEQQEKH
jgi:uncharacterized protein (UPF0548 family)